MKIYTRTGDQGETGLPGGARIRKDASMMDVLGGLDELNSFVGLALSTDMPLQVRHRLEETQHLLFDAGSEVARVEENFDWLRAAQTLETDMDELSKVLPLITFFILPGGTEVAARLHAARSICRRVERCVVAHDSGGNHPHLLAFLNRLSDWLFCAARLANHESGVQDVRWVKQ